PGWRASEEIQANTALEIPPEEPANRQTKTYTASRTASLPTRRAARPSIFPRNKPVHRQGRTCLDLWLWQIHLYTRPLPALRRRVQALAACGIPKATCNPTKGSKGG